MCVERTINGKPISEVMADLAKEIPKKPEFWGGKDDRGNWVPMWISGEGFERWFNEIVGPLNYSREPSEIKMVTVGDKLCATVHLEVTIMDDNGNVVCKKGANGSSETGNGDLKSNFGSAETEAFKHLCMDMGIGSGQITFITRKQKINATASQETESSSRNTAPLPKGEQRVSVTFKEPFTNKKAYYAAKAVDQDGRLVTVKIFANKLQYIADSVGSTEQFFASIVPGASMQLSGEYDTYKGEDCLKFWGF